MSEDQTARILEAIGVVRSDLLAAIRSEFEGLRTEFRSEIATLRSRMDALEARLTSVRVDVMAPIDRLQDTGKPHRCL
jgi:BMFP domain-containing protein YqiC